MKRLVAIVAAVILMLSHAGMGEAAPHHAGDEAHAGALADNDAHHLPAWDVAGDDDDRDGRGLCHVVHVHNPVDMARADDGIARFAPPAAALFAPLSVVAPGSRAVAPLLEPPSA